VGGRHFCGRGLAILHFNVGGTGHEDQKEYPVDDEESEDSDDEAGATENSAVPPLHRLVDVESNVDEVSPDGEGEKHDKRGNDGSIVLTEFGVLGLFGQVESLRWVRSFNDAALFGRAVGREGDGALGPVVGDVVLLEDRQADDVEGRIDGLDVDDAEGSIAGIGHVLDVVVNKDFDFPTVDLEVKVGEVDLARGVDSIKSDIVFESHLCVKFFNDVREPQARDANLFVSCVEDGVDIAIIDDDRSCIFIVFKAVVVLLVYTELDRGEGEGPEVVVYG